MRTRIIIALALSVALFGFYLLDDRPSLTVASLTPAAMPAGEALEASISAPVAQLAPRDTGGRADVPVDDRPGCSAETRYAVNADGSVTTLLSCEPAQEPPRSEYENYPGDALANLAWSDALAAEVLAMRLRETDPTAALSLILRAAALRGGDPAPVLAFSNAYPKPTSIDGVLVRETVHTRFVLAAVAEMLGGGPNLLPYWETQIRSVSTDPQREIRILRDRARTLVDEMQRIELEVTGSSTFGGQSDA